MKNKLRYLLISFSLFGCFLCQYKCYASHAVGSEIFYSCTASPGIYNVTLKIYRDCAGIQLCSNCPTSLSSTCTQSINITGAGGSCNGTSFGTSTLTVVTSVSGLDVIQLCSSSQTTCSNCGTRTPGSITPGIEVYVFTGQVNLSGLPASCCLVSLNFSVCCRNSAITTLSNPSSLNFYSEAIVNRCASPCNSSPVFNIAPDFILAAGADAVVHVGASDPDGDSLVYNLAPSLTGAGTAAPYASPYSTTVPFPYLGAPVQSPPAVLPVGINVDHLTGAVRFRPQGFFVSNFVMEVSQWRTLAGVPTLMGKTRRDHQIYGQSMTFSALSSVKKYDTAGTYIGIAPVIDSITICAGRTICRTIVAATNNIGDTTNLIWNNPVNMAGATFTPLYNAALRATNGPRMDSFRFCWTAPLSAGSNAPFVAIFIAKSRACTYPHKSSSALVMYVDYSGTPAGTVNKTLIATNTYKLRYTSNGIGQPVKSLTQWKIETAPNSNSYATFNSDSINSYQFIQSGKYRIKVLLTGGGTCANTITVLDSLTTTSLSISTSLIKAVVCRGDSTGMVSMASTNGIGPVMYKLNNGSYQSSNTFANLLAGNYSVKAKDSLNFSDSINFNITQPDSFVSISFNSLTNLRCKGDSSGSATLIVRNGKAPYQYKMNSLAYQSNNVFNKIAAGVQTFYIKDSNNCKASLSATFTEPSTGILLSTTSIKNVACVNDSSGSVTLNAGNGNGLYQYKKYPSSTYQSSNIFSGLKAGAQAFTVIDTSGCTAYLNVNITQPATGLSLQNTTITGIGCNGDSTGAVSLSASGGKAPYLYKLFGSTFQTSNNFTGLKAGTFTSYAIDSNNCGASKIFTLIDPIVLSSIRQVSNVKCYGQSNGSIKILASGGRSPFQYKLGTGAYTTNNTFSNLAPGTYSVTIKDSSNCLLANSATVSQALPFISALISSNTSCAGISNGSASIQLSGSTAPYAYSWNTSPVQTTANAINLAAGYAFVTYTDSNLCVGKDSVLIGVKPMFNNEKLCAVSNDTFTGKNLLLWDKTSSVGIASYHLYAATTLAGPFALVASPLFNTSGSVSDNVTGKPSQAYYYYLKSVDSCNVESTPSPLHRSMFLNANALTGNKVGLNWNRDTSIVTASTLIIKRSINGAPFTIVSQVPLTTISFIDNSNISGIKKYMLDLSLTNNCASIVNHIYSNIAIAGVTGINEQYDLSNSIEVYPNPTEGSIKITSMKGGNSLQYVEVYNLMGSKVKEQSMGNMQDGTLDLTSLANGMYHLVVLAGEDNRYVFKVVLSR